MKRRKLLPEGAHLRFNKDKGHEIAIIYDHWLGGAIPCGSSWE